MANKPPKPHPNFPLYAHAAGQWAKRIRGKVYYFGVWDDPQAALGKYLDQRDDLHAGRQPRVIGLRLGDACNLYLASQDRMRQTGGLSERTWRDNLRTCRKLIELLGRGTSVESLRVEDFERLREQLAAGASPLTLGTWVVRIRAVFRYLYDAALIPNPPQFGPKFVPPSQKSLRQAREKLGVRLFSPEEIGRLLEHATPAQRAMILLGLNCGCGNTDLAQIEWSHLDLAAGWLKYARPKTGVRRQAPLWPETVAALTSLPHSGGLVFRTSRGRPLVHGTTDTVVTQFRKLLDAAGVERRAAGFYCLRHTFRTVADELGDDAGCRIIMGHADGSIDARYVEQRHADRLRRITDHVRARLLGKIDQC